MGSVRPLLWLIIVGLLAACSPQHVTPSEARVRESVAGLVRQVQSQHFRPLGNGSFVRVGVKEHQFLRQPGHERP